MVPKKRRSAGGIGFVFEAWKFRFGYDEFEMDSRDAH